MQRLISFRPDFLELRRLLVFFVLIRGRFIQRLGIGWKKGQVKLLASLDGTEAEWSMALLLSDEINENLGSDPTLDRI